MTSLPKIRGWQEEPVDRFREHFELRYGSVANGGWIDWIPVAVVGSPDAGTVNVQFLIETDDPRMRKLLTRPRKSSNFPATVL